MTIPLVKKLFRVYEKRGLSVGNPSALSKVFMPGNTITVKLNNSEELEWYVGDSRIDLVIGLLNWLGVPSESDSSTLPQLDQASLEELFTSNIELVRLITKKIYDKETSHGQDKASSQTK